MHCVIRNWSYNIQAKKETTPIINRLIISISFETKLRLLSKINNKNLFNTLACDIYTASYRVRTFNLNQQAYELQC